MKKQMSVLIILISVLAATAYGATGDRMFCVVGDTGDGFGSWKCQTKAEKDIWFDSIQDIMNKGWSPMSVGAGNGSSVPNGDFKPWLSIFAVIFEREL